MCTCTNSKPIQLASYSRRVEDLLKVFQSTLWNAIYSCNYFINTNQFIARGPQRGCNLVRLPCNPSVIFRNLCNL